MTATAPTTVAAQATEEFQDACDVDASSSAPGLRHRCRVSPARPAPRPNLRHPGRPGQRGGTWWTYRYRGLRSDSALSTYGYRFEPWRGPSIAAGEEILTYLGEVIDEYGLDDYIRYQHRVTAASWFTEDRRWTVRSPG